jgi:hypothetical protein
MLGCPPLTVLISLTVPGHLPAALPGFAIRRLQINIEVILAAVSRKHTRVQADAPPPLIDILPSETKKHSHAPESIPRECGCAQLPFQNTKAYQ